MSTYEHDRGGNGGWGGIFKARLVEGAENTRGSINTCRDGTEGVCESAAMMPL